MRPSIKDFRNSNASARIINGDDSRIFPGLENTAFNRGNRKLSQQQQQISGNQIMLQRQKRRTMTNKRQKQQYQQHERQNQQHQEQPAKQEQENFGDYTMERGKFSQRRDGNADIDIINVCLCYNVLILHLRIYYNLLHTTYDQSCKIFTSSSNSN